MNFIEKILEQNWINYKTDLFPKDRRMKIIDDAGIQGMNTENIRFLINEIVKQRVKDGVYLEVGTYNGASLLSASYMNTGKECIGIDNFSQFNVGGNNFEILKKNVESFQDVNVMFYPGDYRSVLPKLFSEKPDLKIDVFFYDGNHSYKDQLYGLNYVLPYLSDDAIIIVDDANWEDVELSSLEFLKQNPDFKSLIKIKTDFVSSTEKQGGDDWWNGIQVFQKIEALDSIKSQN